MQWSSDGHDGPRTMRRQCADMAYATFLSWIAFVLAFHAANVYGNEKWTSEIREKGYDSLMQIIRHEMDVKYGENAAPYYRLAMIAIDTDDIIRILGDVRWSTINCACGMQKLAMWFWEISGIEQALQRKVDALVSAIDREFDRRVQHYRKMLDTGKISAVMFAQKISTYTKKLGSVSINLGDVRQRLVRLSEALDLIYSENRTPGMEECLVEFSKGIGIDKRMLPTWFREHIVYDLPVFNSHEKWNMDLAMSDGEVISHYTEQADGPTEDVCVGGNLGIRTCWKISSRALYRIGKSVL